MLYHDGYDDFQNLEATVETIVANLRERIDEFESIVVTGISGQCVGFPVALALGKTILVLRKMDDTSHGIPGQLLNAKVVTEGDRVLFLDDFIGAGGTIKRCREAVEKLGAEIIARYMYRDHLWSPCG